MAADQTSLDCELLNVTSYLLCITDLFKFLLNWPTFPELIQVMPRFQGRISEAAAGFAQAGCLVSSSQQCQRTKGCVVTLATCCISLKWSLIVSVCKDCNDI